MEAGSKEASCLVFTVSENKVILFLIAEKDEKYQGNNAAGNVNISYIKGGKINQGKIDEIHHISAENTVNKIPHSPGKYNCCSKKQGPVIGGSRSLYKKVDNGCKKYKTDQHQKQKPALKKPECHAPVLKVPQHQNAVNQGNACVVLQATDCKKLCNLVKKHQKQDQQEAF